MMRGEARNWHEKMGGQRPWVAVPELTNVYMVYNDADPWTGPGARQRLGCRDKSINNSNQRRLGAEIANRLCLAAPTLRPCCQPLAHGT